MENVALRYHEIALKKGNRAFFEAKLAKNARALLEAENGVGTAKYEFRNGRILLRTPWNHRTRTALGRLFGATSFGPVRTVTTQLDAVQQAALEEFQKIRSKDEREKVTFRVESRRSDKVLAASSMDLDRQIGAAILDAAPSGSLKVRLKNPDLTVHVEVRARESYVWTIKHPGAGGLPVGTNASVLTLMSGGIDSPVAAIRAMKRGSSSSFLHFYGTPFVGAEVLNKVEALVKLVNRFNPHPAALYIIPFGKIQEKIAKATQPRLRTLLYRRMMVRVGNEVARRIGAKALVTGESMGQVASQTIENLGTVNAVAELPIIRPLVSFDKDEIVTEAKRLGTFETSIAPGEDCCTLFADKHPMITGTPEMLAKEEEKFPVAELTAEALALIEKRTY